MQQASTPNVGAPLLSSSRPQLSVRCLASQMRCSEISKSCPNLSLESRLDFKKGVRTKRSIKHGVGFQSGDSPTELLRIINVTLLVE